MSKGMKDARSKPNTSAASDLGSLFTDIHRMKDAKAKIAGPKEIGSLFTQTHSKKRTRSEAKATHSQANLEKALREMRSEHAEIKFTADSKLAEANALFTSVQEKSLEIEAKFAELSKKLEDKEKRLLELEEKLNAREKKLSDEHKSILDETAKNRKNSKRNRAKKRARRQKQQPNILKRKGKNIVEDCASNSCEIRLKENVQPCKHCCRRMPQASSPVRIQSPAPPYTEGSLKFAMTNQILRVCDDMVKNGLLTQDQFVICMDRLKECEVLYWKTYLIDLREITLERKALALISGLGL